MDRALWFLFWLRLVGWLRRLRRTLSSVKGMLLAIVGLMIFLLWLLPSLLLAEPQSAEHLVQVRRYGPLLLLFFCISNVIFSSGERAISFSPAEVNLLFAAPFSRRQLLLYKILGSFAAALLSALILAVVLRQHTTGYLPGMLGLLLAMLFMQLFSMLLALVASLLGAAAYNRQRKVVLVLLLAAAGVLLWRQGLTLAGSSWPEILTALTDNPILQELLTPFRWLILTATAPRLWPDLVQYAALSLTANLVLLLGVLALDASYLEAATAASEKQYQRIERLRRGGLSAASLRGGEKKWSLPALPRWGGIGPLVWRQLTAALRSPWWLVMVAFFFGMLVVPMFFSDKRNLHDTEMLGVVLLTLLMAMAMFVPTLLTFDFRSDLDRMDVLKSLPIPVWRLVTGQILAPVLLVTGIQCLLMIVMQWALADPTPWVLIGMPFAVSLNFLLFGIENLFFLWFPIRQVAAGPGDFHNLGRQMLLWAVKMLVVGVTVGLAVLLGALTYLLAGESWLAGGLVAWLVLTASALGVIPLLCLAFQGFDVASDTPP